MKVSIVCPYCGQSALKERGLVNRAHAVGAAIYCSRECSGLGRRKGKTKAQKVEEKRLYDAEYRVHNRDMLKLKKHQYFKRSYDPKAAVEARKKIMPRHIEYCRRPAYRSWKRQYDRKYRAAKQYGEFAECFVLVMDIRDECLSQMSDYEIRCDKETINKKQRRRRDYARSFSEEPQVGPLGYLERSQGRKNGSVTGG